MDTRIAGGVVKAAMTAGVVMAAFAGFAADVTLTGSDTTGQSSWNTAGYWSDNAAPSAGNTYVVPNGKTLRTPNATTPCAFAGDSLVLQDGAKVVLKHANQTSASANWVAYGCQISAGREYSETTGFGGTLEVKGTADSPTVFSGSGDRAFRAIGVTAALRGESDAVVRVARTQGTSGSSTKYEDDTDSFYFTCTFSGDNADYKGRFETTAEGSPMVAPWVVAFASQSALGAPLTDGNAKLTLGDGFVLNGGELSFTDGYALALAGDATLAAESLSFRDGGIVKGSGSSVLTLSAPTVLADATFDGVAKVVCAAAVSVRLGYAQTAVPLEVAAGGSLSSDGSPSVGSVTLASGAALAPGLGTLEVASLELAAGSSLRTSVAMSDGAVSCGFVRVTGDLTVPAHGKVAITIDAWPSDAPAGTKVALLSAANLATDFAADDFLLTFADDVFAGDLSIETVDGAPTLFFTSRETVRLTGNDVTNGDSWQSGKNWSDGLAPSGEKGYVVPSGTLLRRSTWGQNNTFAGHSLTIAKGGDFAIVARTADVGDLRLYDGGVISTRGDGDANRLSGTITSLGAWNGDETADFKIEANSQTLQERSLNLDATLKGAGNLRFRYYDSSKGDADSVANKGSPTTYYLVTGDNSDFSGRIILYQSSVCVDFKDESAMGGPAPEFLEDRLRFAYGATLRASTSYSISEPTRGIFFGEGPTTDDGGRIEVAVGATLTISSRISGATTLRKRGAGTLALCGGENAFSGTVRHEQGLIRIGAAGAVANANLLGEDGAVWCIDTPDGMTVKGLDAIAENAAGATEIVVVPAALLETGDQKPKSVDAKLVRVKGTADTAAVLERVKLDSETYGKNWTFKLIAEVDGDDVVVSVKARKRGLFIIIR